MTAAATAPSGASDAPTDADAVAGAVLTCAAVASLHAGGTRLVTTYLPGRRVVGVRCGEHAIEVSVVAAFGATVGELDAQVRAALATHANGRAVEIFVADIQTSQDPLEAYAPPALAPGPS